MGIETAVLLPALIGAGGALGGAALNKTPKPAEGQGPHGTYSPQPVFPGVQNTFGSWLEGQVGRGGSPYPGSVNAPRDPNFNNAQDTLNQWMLGQGGNLQKTNEGLTNYLTNFGRRTDNVPIPEMGQSVTALPAWQAMVAAQQRNIGQNAAGLRETFSGLGSRYGSGIANTMSDYYNQANLQQNAMLTEAERASLENSKQRDIQISQLGFGKEGINLQAAHQLAQYLSAQQQLGPAGFNQQMAMGMNNQQMNQQDVSRLYTDWLRQQPEYSQLLPYLQGAATAYPPFNGLPQYQQNPWAGVVNTGAGIGMEVLMEWLRKRGSMPGLGGVPNVPVPGIPPPDMSGVGNPSMGGV